MKSLSFTLRVAAILAAVLSAVLYLATQGKLSEMDDRLRAAIEKALEAEAELATYREQLGAIEQELTVERANASGSKQTVERLRAEMYTARQEVFINRQELAKAQEKIKELESSGRRLRQNLVETEQIFAKPSTQPLIESLNARIIELEDANLQLVKDLHRAKQQNSASGAL